MTAHPVVPGVLQCEFGFAVGSDGNAIVKKYYKYGGSAPSGANCVTIATDLLSLVSAYYLALMDASRSIEQVVVTDLTGPSAGTGTYANLQAGTRTGSQLGASVSVLSNGHITRRYRGGKPRSYWPFGVDTDLTGPQVWDNTFVGLVDAAVALFETGALSITAGGCSITDSVSVSFYAGFVAVENVLTGRWRNVPTVRSGTIPVDIVNQWTTSPKVASQRRRNLQRS